MAQFLTRKGIVYHLDRIIGEAEKEIILISPYIRADDETKELLKDKRRNTAIHVIYGKKELRADEKSFLDSLGIKTSFVRHLHAKCYLNEREALVTSMNLYKFSQEHNDEMGILVSREDDGDLYRAIYDQAIRWKRADDGPESAGTGRAGAKVRKSSTRTRRATGEPGRGFCIRCRKTLKVNPGQPYCKRCYGEWRKYGNEQYEDEFCHTCGREFAATLLRPLCSSCYRKNKRILDSVVR